MTAAMIAPSTRMPIEFGHRFRIAHAGLLGQRTDDGQNLLLMGQGQRADAGVFLVVLGHRVDEGAAIEAFLLEPVLQHVEDADQLVRRRPSELVHSRLKPGPPGFAFPFQHGENKAFLEAELVVQRHLGDPASARILSIPVALIP